ncbi:hypothetical protein BJ166DRAFT_338353 [Pestalotiopsis sp. NC0098]|nr:hypothetical protein BJ166DRAFT_338353 [Pestalotiopsis sp. NC0098]
MEDKNVGPASIYSITPLILAVCIRTTMEWEFGQTNDKDSLLDVFAESIARTASRQVVLYDEFKKTLTTEENIKEGSKQPLREIRKEIKLLQEVNDILDELNIIKSVLLSQESIMEECIEFLKLAVSAESLESTGPLEIDEERKSLLQTYYYCRTLSRIDRFQEQVEKMTQDAKDVQHNLNNLLDLRQKDANLAEAIWARKASEESTRQSRTITVFTVVTIIFLPITFLSSLFALDITSFPHNDKGDLQYSPNWAFSWLSE